MAKGLLVAGFNYSMVDAGEFNDWYDTEHVPERQRCKGFINCVRWQSVSDPKVAVATYDLESHSVLHSPPYQAIGRENLSPWSKRMTSKVQRLIRIEGEQVTPGDQVMRGTTQNLMLFSCKVPPEHQAEIRKWYTEEHIPNLGSVPGTVSARFFQSHAGTHTFVALYEIESAEVCSSDAWKKAAYTPWTERTRDYRQDVFRVVLKRYQRAAA